MGNKSRSGRLRAPFAAHNPIDGGARSGCSEHNLNECLQVDMDNDERDDDIIDSNGAQNRRPNKKKKRIAGAGVGGGGSQIGSDRLLSSSRMPYGRNEPNPDDDDDQTLATTCPSRVTHGFWLRQYSGLHEQTTDWPASTADDNHNPSHSHHSPSSQHHTSSHTPPTHSMTNAAATNRPSQSRFARWRANLMARRRAHSHPSQRRSRSDKKHNNDNTDQTARASLGRLGAHSAPPPGDHSPSRGERAWPNLVESRQTARHTAERSSRPRAKRHRSPFDWLLKSVVPSSATYVLPTTSASGSSTYTCKAPSRQLLEVEREREPGAATGWTSPSRLLRRTWRSGDQPQQEQARSCRSQEQVDSSSSPANNNNKWTQLTSIFASPRSRARRGRAGASSQVASPVKGSGSTAFHRRCWRRQSSGDEHVSSDIMRTRADKFGSTAAAVIKPTSAPLMATKAPETTGQPLTTATRQTIDVSANEQAKNLDDTKTSDAAAAARCKFKFAANDSGGGGGSEGNYANEPPPPTRRTCNEGGASSRLSDKDRRREHGAALSASTSPMASSRIKNVSTSKAAEEQLSRDSGLSSSSRAGAVRETTATETCVATETAADLAETSRAAAKTVPLGSDAAAAAAAARRRQKRISGSSVAAAAPHQRDSDTAAVVQFEQQQRKGDSNATTSGRSQQQLRQQQRVGSKRKRVSSDTATSASATAAEVAGGGTVPSISLLPLIQPTLGASSSSSLQSCGTGGTGGSLQSQSSLATCSLQQVNGGGQVSKEQRRTESSMVASQAATAVETAGGRSADNDAEDNGHLPATTVKGEPPATSSGSGLHLRTNFKKLVKRQQSVDSYRMARDLKQKLKRQQQAERNKHQSNEAIKQVAAHSGAGSAAGNAARKLSMRIEASLAAGATSVESNYNTYVARLLRRSGADNKNKTPGGGHAESDQCRINVAVMRAQSADDDPKGNTKRVEANGSQYGTDIRASGSKKYVDDDDNDQNDDNDNDDNNNVNNNDDNNNHGNNNNDGDATSPATKRPAWERRVGPPTPPNTLSLMPTRTTGAGATPGAGKPHSGSSGAASLLGMGSAFSGCITPTYPTHHLPSPKYVSPSMLAAAEKKYSNASTISQDLLTGTSSVQVDLSGCGAGGDSHRCSAAGMSQNSELTGGGASIAGAGGMHLSDTESSLTGGGGGPSATPANNGAAAAGAGTAGTGDHPEAAAPDSQRATELKAQQEAQVKAEAEAAARRAQLAEHIYDNKCGLGEDMKFLASLPELCDITFLVGETREPVCAVKSVLAARSRVFNKILFGNRAPPRPIRATTQSAMVVQHQQQRRLVQTFSNAGKLEESTQQQRQQQQRDSYTGAEHLTAVAAAEAAKVHSVSGAKERSRGSPVFSRNASPACQQQQPDQQHQQSVAQQHWSVTSDATGYNNPVDGPPGSSTGGRSTTQPPSDASGRASRTSNGRDSVVSSATSATGSLQPLIIGPGQTATLAPPTALSRRAGAGPGGGGKRSGNDQSSSGTSRLSRMFMKRASDPSIKQQPHQQQLPMQQQLAAQTDAVGQTSYLDKMSSLQMSTTMIIEEFEPDVFRQLIEYIHTGCVLLQARTLLGLLNAADYYGLEQLRKACLRFVSYCITVDTVSSLLSTAERYIQYKCTKSIVQKVLEFVDTHADEVFKLNSFGLLPEHVVRLILARDGLRADEYAKYNGVHTWCEHYCRSYELTNIADVMRNFLDLIQFHKIPTNVLLNEIYPTHIVPDHIFLSALAYQADPENFEPLQSTLPRRMTLPNPSTLKDLQESEYSGPATGDSGPNYGPGSMMINKPGSKASKRRKQLSRKKSSAVDYRRRESVVAGATARLFGGGRKSQAQVQYGQQVTGGATAPGAGQSSSAAAAQKPATQKRRGSIAQVSISGVMRLSHKLSIRKKPGQAGKKGAAGAAAADAATNAGEAGSGANEQQPSRDPMQVGQQILNAYLMEQRRKEAEAAKAAEEERRRQEAEAAAAAAAAAPSSNGARQSVVSTDGPSGGSQSAASGATGTGSSRPSVAAGTSSMASGAVAAATAATTPGATGGAGQSQKSFRDFRHISRRLFMRHSSSKQLQQQSSSVSSGASSSATATTATATSTSAAKPMDRSVSDARQSLSSFSASATTSATQGHNQQQQQVRPSDGKQHRRHLLRIKRSETVFESPAHSTHPQLQPLSSQQLSSSGANVSGRKKQQQQ